jgi:hypothetical protein
MAGCMGLQAGEIVLDCEIGAPDDHSVTHIDDLQGVKPSADTHFPIFGSEQEMIDPVTGIEGKNWLSKRGRAAIKALKPYEGGDYAIWPLHQLDIRRKHERLIFANVDPSGFYWERGRPGGQHGFFMTGGLMPLQRSENKTILAMIPAHVLPAPEGGIR